ncbi:MAG TPA: hypothetical protein VLA06_03695 [Woeseiaceae bacterium]|nr:hypothetical protein [Woeseiaceae bacterium]
MLDRTMVRPGCGRNAVDGTFVTASKAQRRAASRAMEVTKGCRPTRYL